MRQHVKIDAPKSVTLSAPIRVVRVVTRLNIGGPSIQAIALSERLPARGFPTRLVHGALGAGEGDMRYLASDPAGLQFVPTLQRAIAPLDDVRTVTTLVGVLREVRPHIVHTHMAKAGTLGRIAAALYNRTRGSQPRARVVHTYHGHVLDGYFSPARTRLFVGIERQLARITDAIVAISREIRRELAGEHRIGRPEQYHVIPLGFELGALASIDDRARALARERLGIPANAHVVSTVGRLTAIKDHRLFFEAARRVAVADPAALFLIAGDGELRAELERTAADLGIGGRTRFLGWRRDLDTIYGATDVFLLTSRNEGTPVALIESMAAGVPGVSTDVGGVRDVIESDAIGLVAPAGDSDALAHAVTSLLADEARRRTIGASGRASVLARYGLDRLVSDIDALYRSLLA